MRTATALALALICLAPDAAAEAPRAAARPSSAALEAARQFLCPHGGTPVRGQRGGRCRMGSTGSVLGWDAGLAAPAHRQSACPEGTTAVAVPGRADATRCMPR